MAPGFVCLFRLLLIGGCVMVLCVSLVGGFVVVCGYAFFGYLVCV